MLQTLRSMTSDKMTKPVTLRPGRLILAISPALTGSPPIPKTTGMVDVAALAARAEACPQIADEHVHTAANKFGGKCLEVGHSRPRAQRYSMATFFPSTKPLSSRPL